MSSRLRRAGMTLAALVALGVAGCGGNDDDGGGATATQAATAAKGTDLSAIKDYLLAHTERLVSDTGKLRADAEAYYALAKGADFDYGRLLADKRSEVAATVKKLQTDFADANPAYEEMEGVVAGVPSLADFDVIIDAGGDASDPENAVPFSVKTPAGRTFKQPGNFNYLIETSTFGTEPRFVAKGVKPDLDGDGKVAFGEALPDADFLVAAARDFETSAKELDAAARKWSPTQQDAFTALVVMTPTMSEYFEAWKNSRFIAGDKADGEGLRRRLAPAGHRRHPRRAEPRLRQRRGEHRQGRRAAGQPDRRLAAEAADLRRGPAQAGGGRQEVHRPGRRHPRGRGAGPGRGHRRPGHAGGRAARDQAGGLTARCARSPSHSRSSCWRRRRPPPPRRPGARPRRCAPGCSRRSPSSSSPAPTRPAMRWPARAGATGASSPPGSAAPTRAPTPMPAVRWRPRRAPPAPATTRAWPPPAAPCAPRSSAAPSPPRSRPSSAATRRPRAIGCCCASSARRRASPAPGPTPPSRSGACRPAGSAPARPAPPWPRTCSTPTRRACASCSTTPRAARSATCPSAAPRPRRRPRATSPILAARYAQDRGAPAAARAARRLRRACAKRR